MNVKVYLLFKHSLFMFCFNTYVYMCRSSAAVKLLASESLSIVEGQGFESRRQFFFLLLLFFCFLLFFFFFNIHTSDKLEIFFDHSILVNAALMALPIGYTPFSWRH